MTRFPAFALAAAGALLLQVPGKAASPDGKDFPSAEAAAQALFNAAKSDDTAALGLTGIPGRPSRCGLARR